MLHSFFMLAQHGGEMSVSYAGRFTTVNKLLYPQYNRPGAPQYVWKNWRRNIVFNTLYVKVHSVFGKVVTYVYRSIVIKRHEG